MRLERLYRRLGPRYLEVSVLWQWAVSMACGAMFPFGIVVPYEDPPLEELLALLAVVEVGLTAAVVAANASWLRAGRPLADWLAEGAPRESAPMVWRIVVRLPYTYAASAFVWGVLFAAVPTAVFSWQLFDFTHAEAVYVLIVLLLGGILLILFSYLAQELYLRPPLRHLATQLPLDFDPGTAGMRLPQRLLAFQILVTAGGGILVTYGLTVNDKTLREPALGLALTAVATVGITFALGVQFNRLFAEPIADLLRATRVVRSGELLARVPIVSDDEHGELAASFNEMIAELQGARAHLVTAREEERRRLRRDLHDGLGPTLSGVAMRLEAAAELVERDPSAARTLLDEVRADTAHAIADIRRLVHGLRPPQLDELGLVGAIEERARTLAPDGMKNGLRIVVRAPDAMPALPAALEVAAYRIAEEALTNAVRHSQARSCSIHISVDGALTMEVIDDGVGLPESLTPGVGLSSMRERVGELGGSCAVERAPTGGTSVHVRLPWPKEGR